MESSNNTLAISKNRLDPLTNEDWSHHNSASHAGGALRLKTANALSK